MCLVCKSCQKKSTYQDFRKKNIFFVCLFLMNFYVCIKGRLAPQEDAIRGYVPVALVPYDTGCVSIVG